MINIKSQNEIDIMKEAGHIVYVTHKYLQQHIKAGITTKELDKLANDFIESKGAKSSILNYNGFPGSICTSINNQVVHGIPSNRKLKNGDIISIDISVIYKGYQGDSAWTYPVGNIDDKKKYLLEHTEKALYEGIKQVKPGAHIGDIGAAVEAYATSHNLGVVRELVGHGIGTNLHEEPDVPNYGKQGTGPVLKEGMTIAIEPMLNLGTRKVFIEEDDWTIITQDGLPSAHFEHTVAVTKDGYQIMTGDDNCE